ncbi:hypothetical protein L1049_006836 [Liquidambar formosana]|uniref:DUF7912 domain-containing protein n=1 Tax=Liquidambar formosana TaxID=63359 RepID=A0AAP0RG64_LIQFO
MARWSLSTGFAGFLPSHALPESVMEACSLDCCSWGLISYGCPSIEEIESYSEQYKKRLDEIGVLGEIPDNLALEVSSPGAERLLRVPDDLYRFIDMPMRVCYVEEVEAKCPEKDGVFLLESVETESENCVWKLADVKENRDPLAKGRPLSRKQKDWRLKLPYAMFRRVSLFVEY